MKNDTLIKALNGQAVDFTPVWLMRQAGRYLPEYREIRAKAGSFMALCTNPELACEVTLQPLRRFDLDAAILFSDILTIPDAMGLGLYFVEGEGPKFKKVIASESDIANLTVPDPEQDLSYVPNTIRLLKPELDVPLIGFSGSPWTLACYMLQGDADKSFSKIFALQKENPKALHQLLDVLARSVAEYLKAQIAAGVDVTMIFDTWGGLLDEAQYQTYSLPYINQIAEQLNVPTVLFARNSHRLIGALKKAKTTGLGLDWHLELNEARQLLDDQFVLQGNMNPEFLYESDEAIRAEVQRILTSYGKGSRYIFNLGHGMVKDMDPAKVSVLVDAVHEFSRR